MLGSKNGQACPVAPAGRRMKATGRAGQGMLGAQWDWAGLAWTLQQQTRQARVLEAAGDCKMCSSHRHSRSLLSLLGPPGRPRKGWRA